MQTEISLQKSILICTRYFRGVLFLTTNRVQAFDQAFQSRIHLSLHYSNLSRVAREKLWRAFLQRIWNKDGLQELTVLETRKLSKTRMNGRQIKNVIQLAVALADHENAELTFDHLARTLRAVDEGSITKGLVHRAKEFFGLG
jgi:SpoVK/Ycf46/Vps4 family AAA+-type ATPase